MKIALTMIVSGNETKETLEKCFQSILPWVDGAYVVVTSKDKNDLVKFIESHRVVVEYKPKEFFKTATKEDIDWLTEYLGTKPKIQIGEKIFQFDQARNYSMSMIPKEYEWIFWCDADDIVRNAEKLHQVADLAKNSRAEAVFMNYLYQVELDKDNKIKHIIIEHLRERLVANNGSYEWIAPIHETLIEKHPTRKIKAEGVDLIHLADDSERKEALIRNIKTLELHISDQKGKDPRPIYYLGKAYFDTAVHMDQIEAFKPADKLFDIYLFGTKEYEGQNRSGWAEERSQCWEYKMEIQRKQDKLEESIISGMNALIENDTFPSTYLNISLSYLLKGRFDRAKFWVKLAASIPQPETTLINNPKDQQGRALEILYNANIQTNELDKAWAAATKLLEMFPDNPTMKERVQFTEELKMKRKLIKAALRLSDYITLHEDHSKLKPLFLSLPEIIKNTPFIDDIAKKINPPKDWGSKEIAIYCGPGFTQWSPKTLLGNTSSFVGGSEEAVIYLARELNKLDWQVTVYADPMDDEGDHDGVNYQPYYKFSPKDNFNVLVIWRQPGMVDNNYKAKKIYIWCHDIQNQLDYTKERLDKIEKVIVLSPWHRTNVPNIPDNKIMISANGVAL